MLSWKDLNTYAAPLARPYLSQAHRHGIKQLKLDENQPPNIENLTDVVEKQTGWQLVRAEGEVPRTEFFHLLANKRFPLVHELRETNSLFSSAFPDFWHEVYGHLPFLWNKHLSDFYQELGRRASLTTDENELEHITKLYWFICEYGLIKEDGALKMIGAGLIASPVGSFKMKKGAVKLRPVTKATVQRESLNPYKYQDTLFFIESLESLYQL